MELDNYIRSLEIRYRVEINKELRKTIAQYFGEDSNIYTEQDLYEQTRKIIQNYKDKYYK